MDEEFQATVCASTLTAHYQSEDKKLIRVFLLSPIPHCIPFLYPPSPLVFILPSRQFSPFSSISIPFPLYLFFLLSYSRLLSEGNRCIDSKIGVSYVEVFGDTVSDLLKMGARCGHSKVRTVLPITTVNNYFIVSYIVIFILFILYL